MHKLVKSKDLPDYYYIENPDGSCPEGNKEAWRTALKALKQHYASERVTSRLFVSKTSENSASLWSPRNCEDCFDVIHIQPHELESFIKQIEETLNENENNS